MSVDGVSKLLQTVIGGVLAAGLIWMGTELAQQGRDLVEIRTKLLLYIAQQAEQNKTVNEQLRNLELYKQPRNGHL